MTAIGVFDSNFGSLREHLKIDANELNTDPACVNRQTIHARILAGVKALMEGSPVELVDGESNQL